MQIDVLPVTAFVGPLQTATLNNESMLVDIIFVPRQTGAWRKGEHCCHQIKDSSIVLLPGLHAALSGRQLKLRITWGKITKMD